MNTFEFKRKYPRQYQYIINQYGGKSNIFDMSAAIKMYLRGDTLPRCDFCKSVLSITKKFRTPQTNLRCNKHINTKNIVTKDQLFNLETDKYKIVNCPNKLLTKSDQIEVNCKEHGNYKVNIKNFQKGMRCQKCYFESMIGTSRRPVSEDARKKLSILKTGKKVNLSEKSKKEKSEKQKAAWELRKLDKIRYNEYIENLSKRVKQYLRENKRTSLGKEKTGLEIKFEQFLKKHKINFIPQYILEGKRFDFYLIDMNLLVEVDGEYWHRLEPSIKNDLEKHKICNQLNIQLLRISSDNFCPEIIFETKENQIKHTNNILLKRKINGF